LPASNSDHLRQEVVDYFAHRFGVDTQWLSSLSFVERQDEIWATSAPPLPGLHAARLPGLRVLRRAPSGLKPTSVFLSLLGNRITTSRIDVDDERLHKLLNGQRIAIDHSEGHVAIVYRGDVLGCGRLHGGLLRALIPTGRRRELLNALSRFPRAK